MMKKTYKSSLLALSVLASFTSCSESESLQQANLSKDKITFHATLDNSWKPMSPASSSRAAIAAATEKGPIVVPTPFGKPLYLHSVVQETADLQQAAATTRGVMQEGTTLGNTYYNNSFGVTAIYKDNGTNTALFTNQKASKNNEDIWEIEDKTNSRWPFDALVSFHAYAPFNNATDGMWSVTTDADNIKTKIKYTAKNGETEIPSQPDIIVATNAESRSVSSDDKAVELKFSHALTAVNFAISKDLTDIFQTGATDGSKLKSITLSGIPNEGTCELTAKAGDPQTPSQTWTFDTEADGSKKTGSYTFNLENKNITIGESYALTSNEDKNILMMIPQDLQGTDAKLTFVLDIKGKGDQTFTFDLSNQTWLPGTSVTYKLSASAVNHLENAEVKFPDSWKDTEQAKYSYPKTDFATGESIGLYVVNSNNTIEEANVKLTRDQDGKWMPENNNTKFLKLKNYKYFAYYPYSAADPTVDATKDNADEFFKDKISSLSVVADQSNEATLLAQDFQVAKGEIANDGSTLDFNMEHQVGLAVINLKSKTLADTRQFTKDTYKYYYGEGEKPATDDYKDLGTVDIMASNAFVGNKPYRADDAGKKYLQIIPFGRSLTYQASAQATSGNQNGWGNLAGEDYSLSPSANRSVVEKDFLPLCNREFYHLARLYTNTTYDKGQIDEFSTPEITQYKLECWGASSWGAKNTGGGYSYGNYEATEKNKILYVCAGGEGKRGGTYSNNDFRLGGKGGYNGGGNGGNGCRNHNYPGGAGGNGGGGATHIAYKTGLLTEFKDTYQDDVLLVAGGQGGGWWHDAVADNSWGGGKIGAGVYAPFIGVNQGGPPVSETDHGNATFGKGWDAPTYKNCYYHGDEGGGGGGGGLWGGLAYLGHKINGDCDGGGGCGYVNKTHLQNPNTIEGNQEFLSPSRTMEKGHKGGGAAQISWLPLQLTRVK